MWRISKEPATCRSPSCPHLFITNMSFLTGRDLINIHYYNSRHFMTCRDRPHDWNNCYVRVVSLVLHIFLLFSRFCFHLLLTNLTSQGCWQVLQHFAEFLSGCFPSTHWSPLSCKPPDPLLSLVGDPAFCPSCLLPLPCLAAFWIQHFHHPYFPSLISQLQVETFSYFCNDLL